MEIKKNLYNVGETVNAVFCKWGKRKPFKGKIVKVEKIFRAVDEIDGLCISFGDINDKDIYDPETETVYSTVLKKTFSFCGYTYTIDAHPSVDGIRSVISENDIISKCN
jgi:hypothetical protein